MGNANEAQMRAVMVAILGGLVCGFCLGPGPGTAGPWGRSPGAGFTSLEISHAPGDSRLSAFAEYGLAEGYFTNVNLFATKPQGRPFTAEVTVMLARRYGPLWGDLQTSAGLVAGALRGTGPSTAFLGGALSLGRSAQLGAHPGWAALDGQVTWHVRPKELRQKLDLTLGADIGPRSTAMIQLFYSRQGRAESMSLAPSIVFRRPGAARRWQIGAQLPRGGGAARIVLGLWQAF